MLNLHSKVERETRKFYQDHYFLTDPDKFIFEFFPVNPDWQLMDQVSILRISVSTDKFLKIFPLDFLTNLLPQKYVIFMNKFIRRRHNGP
jgi:hypothetical protein